jgi:hypothetical protein
LPKQEGNLLFKKPENFYDYHHMLGFTLSTIKFYKPINFMSKFLKQTFKRMRNLPEAEFIANVIISLLFLEESIAERRASQKPYERRKLLFHYSKSFLCPSGLANSLLHIYMN